MGDVPQVAEHTPSVQDSMVTMVMMWDCRYLFFYNLHVFYKNVLFSASGAGFTPVCRVH